MMNKEQKIIKAKVGLLELAKQLGNVSQACKMMGYSRDRGSSNPRPGSSSLVMRQSPRRNREGVGVARDAEQFVHVAVVLGNLFR